MHISVLFALSAFFITVLAPLPLSAEDNKLFEITPEQAIASIEGDFSKTENAISANAIGSARDNLSLTKYTIYKFRQHLPSDKKKKFDDRVLGLRTRITRKVDSLVNQNLDIVKRNGRSAGYKYRQFLAVQAGLFETDLLRVDNALAENEDKEKVKTPSEDKPRPSQPPVATVPAHADNERERATALSTASKIQEFLAVDNIEEAGIIFRIHEQYLERFLEAPSFAVLKDSVGAASSRRQKAQAEAAGQARNIERLLDRDKIAEAVAALQNKRESLKKHLDVYAMRFLEKKVGQAYVLFLRNQANANRTMGEIRTLLAAKKTENAYSLLEMSRTELERFLYPDAFRILQEEVTKAYNLVQDKKNLSTKIQRDIGSLYKAGKALEAANLFEGNRNLLQQHLTQKEFSTLQTDVVRAKRELRARQTQAESAAASIERQLAAHQVKAAYSAFNEKKESLQKYLVGKSRYPDLKERVMNDWDDLREAQSKAFQLSKKIEELCDRQEGRKAFALFNQESAHLRKYSAPGVYARLEGAVTIANAAYEANLKAARNSCVRINELLSQNQIVRAHTEYQKNENAFFFYLAGDPAAENLQNREAQAWNYWKERNRWAVSTVRQISESIKENRGNAAWSHLQKSRPELRKYIDQHELSRLDGEASRANDLYSREMAQAERGMAIILSLLDQKRVEDACNAFDTLENDIRFYCAPSAFENLKTKVETANDLLQGKKSEARKIIAGINGHVAGKRGDSADAIFSANAPFLMKYCPAPTYKKTAEQVTLALRTYEKNVREAHQLASRLNAMALRTSDVEAAYDQFRYERDFLARYLDKKTFSALEKALQVPYDAFMERRRESRFIANALKRMVRDEHYTIAKFQFDQDDKQLRRFLPADEYMEIMTKVTSAYNNSVRGRASANTKSRRIRSLLKEDQISKAWSLFRESRETLKQYLPEAEFTGLQAEVTSAQEEQEKKTGQAKEFSKMLKHRIAKNQTWEAYRDFKLNRSELSEYLDAQAYADLETTVTNAYEQARRQAKK